MRHYLVTDLETTGLSSGSDVILEAAAVLVTDSLEIVDSIQSIIHEDNDRYLTAVNRVLYGENQFVNKMHTESGLWADWNDDNVPHLTNVGFARKAVEMLDLHDMAPNTVPMMGNSIGSLDRPFIQQQMPILNDWLSYRNMDVSSWRMGIEDRKSGIEAEWERVKSERPDTQHRAMDDALLCIAQLRFYYSRLGLL